MKHNSFNNQNYHTFYSEKMFVSKNLLNRHHLRLTYQRQLLSDLELKHKEWGKCSYEF